MIILGERVDDCAVLAIDNESVSRLFAHAEIARTIPDVQKVLKMAREYRDNVMAIDKNFKTQKAYWQTNWLITRLGKFLREQDNKKSPEIRRRRF